MTAVENSLSGRRIVITGAGRGLGRALAITAADQGADVVLLGRDSKALSSVATLIKARSTRDAETFECDLARPHSIKQACTQVLAAKPVVDALINNGAPWLPGRFAELADAEIANSIAATVTGTVLITKGLLAGLRESKGADIVTIASTAGLLGQRPGTASAPFHGAKHGQSGFSDALRTELKPLGIRVTAVYPPDFEDTDPMSPDWNALRNPGAGQKLTNREVVAAVLFAISAPRVCAYPMILLDNMSGG